MGQRVSRKFRQIFLEIADVTESYVKKRNTYRKKEFTPFHKVLLSQISLDLI